MESDLFAHSAEEVEVQAEAAFFHGRKPVSSRIGASLSTRREEKEKAEAEAGASSPSASTLHFGSQPVDLRLHFGSHVFHLIQEIEDDFHSGQIDPQILRQPLNPLQPIDVRLGIQTIAAVGSVRLDQTETFVEAQGLRVHFAQPSRHADGVNRLISLRHV
jgi:hypothetical protein